MFASSSGFSVSGYRMTSLKFYSVRFWLPWQRNVRQNSACVRDNSEMFASNRGFFGDGLSNDVSQILQRSTLVAMTTKFETK